MKFIGEGHLDSEVLQLGYVSEDGSKPKFSAVEPSQKLSKTLVEQLKYQKASTDLMYQHDTGNLILINAKAYFWRLHAIRHIIYLALVYLVLTFNYVGTKLIFV